MIIFERWDEVKPLLERALGLPEEEREAYLDEACHGDQELLRQAGTFLKISATQADAFDNFVIMPPGVHVADLKEGDEIGAFRIVRPLGRGGMSTVYLAEDLRHKRPVAVKVLTHPRRRQRHEEQTVAQFAHPNIVTLHDSGQVEGGPAYFVMEYVEGEAITTYCERNQLSIEERLKLFLIVCDAVAYAHRHLVIHRDIKPANILVTSERQPKLLDFGIAKSLSPSLAEVTETAPEDRALTVAFASPEQVAKKTTTTATDIYSLGVLLCLMLTGHLPYDINNADELAMAIRVGHLKRPSQLVKERLLRVPEENGPPATELDPRKLERALRGDLDEIVLMALRKEPDRRYSTAGELAADVGRHLNDEPVVAWKGSRRYRAGKFIRRHALGLGATTVLILILVGLSIWLFTLYREATHQRQQAQDQAQRAEQIRDLLVDTLKITDPWKSPKDPTTVQELLEHAKRRVYSELEARPSDQVALLNVLGSIYIELGLRDQSAAVLSSASQISGKRFGKNDALTIESDTLLADALLRLGRDSEAQELNLQVLARAKSILGRQHPITADIVEHLGSVCSFRDDYPCAEAYFKEALAIRRALFGEIHETVASTLNQLGIVHNDAGNLPKAQEMYRQALSIRKKLYPGPHPATAETLNSLAILFHKGGDYSAAEPLYKESLQIRRAAYGSRHITVIASLTNLGHLLKDKGSSQEAERILREAVELGSATLPEGHYASASSMFNLAALLYEVGKYDEAKVLFLKTLQIDTKAFGAGHAKTADSLSHLGMIATAQGSYKEAEELLQRALEIRRRALGDRSTDVASTLNNFGTLFRDRGEYQRAEEVARQAVEIWTEKYGARHPRTLWGQNNLAAILIDLQRLDDAEKILTGTLATARRELGEEHKLVGAVLMNRADLLAAQGRYAAAHSDIVPSLRIFRKSLQANRPALAKALSVQGAVLIGLQRYEEAQKVLRQSQSELKLYEGQASYWTRRTERSLADLARLMTRKTS